jgi:integrase/recombinase XerD
MKQVFKAHRLCRLDGPLGPYIDSYEAEMRSHAYAQQTREVQTRLVADFGCWLAKRRIEPQEITAELFWPYLRARARRRYPTRNDVSALQRLLELLKRLGVVAAPVSPAATATERLEDEFRLYLQQERALASTTQACYTAFASEFLTQRFGAGPVDLSLLCAADVTRFVRRRAVTIRSKRVQLMTTALRSFLRFARYRGDVEKDLAACIPAVANWKQSIIPRALPPDQVEQVLKSVNRQTALGRRDYASLLILARLGGRLPTADASSSARKRPWEVSRVRPGSVRWSDTRWSGPGLTQFAQAPTSSGMRSPVRCSSRGPHCLRSANFSAIAASRPQRFTRRWTWIRSHR